MDLTTALERCITLAGDFPNGGGTAEDYAAALQELAGALLKAEDSELAAQAVSDNTRGSLRTDRSLLSSLFTKEADRASLLSTLVIYEDCKRQGLPDHSPAYMKRVAAARKALENYYQAKL